MRASWRGWRRSGKIESAANDNDNHADGDNAIAEHTESDCFPISQSEKIRRSEREKNRQYQDHHQQYELSDPNRFPNEFHNQPFACRQLPAKCIP